MLLALLQYTHHKEKAFRKNCAMNASILKILFLFLLVGGSVTFTCHAVASDNDLIDNKDEGEAVDEGEVKEEGEGENEGEGEIEGEIEPPVEGEISPDPGKIASVDLLSPRSGMTVVEGDEVVTLLLVAQVQIQDGVLNPALVTVLFSIEDMPYQAAWHESGFFFLSVELPAEPPVREPDEGEGEVVVDEENPEDPYYLVKVIAYGVEEDDYAESAVYEIAIRKGEDSDGNGFADDPFTALQETGDIWFRLTEEEDCIRTTTMKSMEWGGGYTSLFVQNPDDPDQVISVWAANALVEPEEHGVLIVSAACSPAALFEPYDTSAMMLSEPGPLTEGGLYVDASIIYSRDQGLTYDEVTPLRLATNPILVSMNRLETRDGFQNQFYGYPTIVDSDIATGIRIVPLTGQWGEEGVGDLGPTSPDGVHGVNLYRLYAVAPFEVPFPGELSIEPDPTAGYNFGVVKVNHPLTATFVLTNVGGEPLQCDIELEDDSGAFFVQAATSLVLEPDDKYELKIQFNPALAEEYTATVLFYDGGNAPQRMVITGRGALEVKSIQPLGCGASAPEKSGGGMDIVVGIATLAVLCVVGRRRKENAPSR